MKKHYPALLLLMLVFSISGSSQIIGSRMNEVFQKTDISTSGISTPWEITYGPDGYLWVTDSKAYKVFRIDPNTSPYTKITILDLSETSTFTPSSFRRTFLSGQNPWPQGGLAGLAIHPEFMTNPAKKFVYISYVRSYDSTSVFASGGAFFTNRIVRFTYNTSTGQLESPVSLCDTLPGSNDHNSQRMIIAPVNGVPYLFYGQGDMGAGQLSSRWRQNHAQETNSYQGKVLRFNLESDGDAGTLDKWIPNNNPYNTAVQSAVWCMGIRNNQGFAYDSVRDILYASSHGPYSDDEVNIIEPGRNYGHPLVIGYAADENYAGASAGSYPTSTLPTIVSEVANAAAIGVSYKDPLFSGYPTNTHIIDSIWTANTGANAGWPSEAWSGLGLYNYSAIPGWKNSLLMAGLKWGRVVRTKLDVTGKVIAKTGGQDTVCVFDGLPRYRDMAFGPGGKDIYMIMEGSSTIAPLAPSVNNPSLPACANCIQKFTFLGYNSSGGTSTISNLVPIATGIPGNCQVANTITVTSANKNLWIPITDTAGSIIAEINPNNNMLGDVTTTLYVNAAPVREQGFTKALYLDRNLTITPQTQPSTPVSVRLYLTSAEFLALKGASNSASQPSGVNAITDLSIFKNNDVCSPSVSASTTSISTTNQAAFGTGGYVVQANISSFSTFYMANISSLLPYHSLDFKGSIVNNTSQLRWITEDETKLKYFTVERSTNNRDFSSLGTQLASNISGQVIYAFADSSIYRLSSTYIYYRLKLTDRDDKVSYSPIVILNTGAVKSIVNVRPNPVVSDLTVNISAVATEKANWQVTDIGGKTLLQHAINLTKGENEITIRLAGLPAGIYYLKITGGNISQSVKVQKQ